jgi:hypothetical protein
MLDDSGDTVLQAKVGGRKTGPIPNPHARALKEWKASADVLEAVGRGEKKGDGAVPTAAKAHGLSDGSVKARLAYLKRWATRAERQSLHRAARLVHAMKLGGLIETDALAHVGQAANLGRAALVKYMRSKEFGENPENPVEFTP